MVAIISRYMKAIEFSMCLSMVNLFLMHNAKLSTDLRTHTHGLPAMKMMCVSGVEALYVHIMAVNEGAKLFYELHGFTVEQEESSNQAHYR